MDYPIRIKTLFIERNPFSAKNQRLRSYSVCISPTRRASSAVIQIESNNALLKSFSLSITMYMAWEKCTTYMVQGNVLYKRISHNYVLGIEATTVAEMNYKTHFDRSNNVHGLSADFRAATSWYFRGRAWLIVNFSHQSRLFRHTHTHY